MILDADSRIEFAGIESTAVAAAAHDLRRDLTKVCGHADAARSATISLFRDDALPSQIFRLASDADAGTLRLTASDDLGFVYGLYHISRELLGVPDFWFWNDWVPARVAPVDVPDTYAYESSAFQVKERGWFVNDEVLLLGWQVDNDPEQAWQMVYEALLRCGGNMIIPGTGNDSALHAGSASVRGLAIAQHHAEPLGARMFSSVYPDLNPSWDEHADLFQGLWADSIRAHEGQHVIWNVGFRGQGDSPFWCADPTYDTDEARGALMGDIIRVQRRMVLDADPQARCCVYLYGETLELYTKGCLDLPGDVIKIWSDNGYGRMVTRRQNNHNPRVDAMPHADDPGAQGIYYHASFYDLQAANHITTLPNDPSLIVCELDEVIRRGGDDFWIINSSNVKPHVYYLDLIARLWRTGLGSRTPEGFVAAHGRDFAATYFGEGNVRAVQNAYEGYFRAAVPFGDLWDEHAGEQFFNHVPRMLVHQFLLDRTSTCDDLLWATGRRSFADQIAWFKGLCEQGSDRYAELARRNTAACAGMDAHAARLFGDSIGLQTQVYAHCVEGSRLLCVALEEGLAADWQRAFFDAGLARREYQRARALMRSREHGVWRGFYANECLTDIAQSAWVISGLMAFLRAAGDGPHYYQWQRDFIYSRQERKVLTLLNLENHLTDDEMFEAMLVTWEE